MKKLTQVFIAAFIVTRLPAQQATHILPLPPGTQEKSSTAKATVQSSAARAFELIDLTGDSLVLGYLPTPDGSNDRIAVISPVTKQEWLYAAAKEAGIAFFSGKGTNGLFILKDISVGRVSAGNYIRIKAAIYESTPDADAYYLLNTIDTLITDNAPDIKTVSENIGSVIAGTLNTSGIRNAKDRPLTRDEILKTITAQYAFISRGITPTGIYMSYEAFKAGQPSFNQFYLKTDTTSKTVQVNAFTTTDSTLKPVSPWAVVAGNELYIYQNNWLYAAEARGNNLVFSKYIDPETRANNARFWRSNVGARLSNDYGNPFDNLNVLQVSNYRGRGVQGEAIKINTDTGKPEL
ncbi:MAG: hypothetical protein QM640_05525 [Niabella sp.]